MPRRPSAFSLPPPARLVTLFIARKHFSTARLSVLDQLVKSCGGRRLGEPEFGVDEWAIELYFPTPRDSSKFLRHAGVDSVIVLPVHPQEAA